MTCPQCRADLPDGTAFRLKCGSSTRAVAFSYLPEGAPTWPTTPPVRSTQSLQVGEALTAPKPVARPRRSARSVLVLLAFFVLTPLVGVGITLGTLWANGQFPVNATQPHVNIPAAPQQTPATGSASSPTPSQSGQLPTPTSFVINTNTAMGISVKYPGSWVVDAPQTTTSSTTLAFHPQTKIGIDLFIERFTTSTSAKIASTNDVNQNNLASFKGASGIVNFHSIKPPAAQRTLGGDQWDEQDAGFANTGGVAFHLTTIAVQHNHIYYDILFYAPDANYNEATQKYFQPMFDSFLFQ